MKKLKKVKISKLRIFYVVASIAILIMLFILITHKNYKFTRNIDYIDGIKAKETLVVKTSFGKIKKLKLQKTFILDDYYDEYGTYYDAIKSIVKKNYEYLDTDIDFTKEDKTLTFTVETNHDGFVLDNLTITQNGKEKTALRYSGINNLDSDSAIKIGDKFDKKFIKSLGYK